MNYRKSKLIQWVALSIALHLVISFGFYYGKTPTLDLGSKPIEVEIIDRSDARKQQFVTEPDITRLQESLKKLEKAADFLSKETRRVEQEQIARKTGQTQNRDRQAQQKSKPSNSQSQNQSREIDLSRTPLEQANGDLKAAGQNQPRSMNVQLEESTIAEYIPEVQQGGFTSLNTDQFLFYTFYARINEQIRNRWVENIRNFANSNPPYILDQLSRREQVTQIEVILKPNGQYVKSVFHRESQHTGLDQAVMNSFVMAQPFQNPPLEIVADDGFIHLRYEFHLVWRPRSMASGSR